MTGDSDGAATVDRAKRDLHDVAAQRRKTTTIADPKAREFLRKADPILARLIAARPDFHPRAWIAELPPLDAFGTLIFQVTGQQLSVSATLRALAERFIDGRLSDETLSRLTDGEVEAILTEVPGIGPWTAHGFLIVALDRPDVLLSGDLALRRAVERAYGFDHLPTQDEMVQLAKRWRPYRSLAVSYLFASEYEEGT
jgi:DNA-3-methyladenine glycosylase II